MAKVVKTFIVCAISGKSNLVVGNLKDLEIKMRKKLHIKKRIAKFVQK